MGRVCLSASSLGDPVVPVRLGAFWASQLAQDCYFLNQGKTGTDIELDITEMPKPLAHPWANSVLENFMVWKFQPWNFLGHMNTVDHTSIGDGRWDPSDEGPWYTRLRWWWQWDDDAGDDCDDDNT